MLCASKVDEKVESRGASKEDGLPTVNNVDSPLDAQVDDVTNDLHQLFLFLCARVLVSQNPSPCRRSHPTCDHLPEAVHDIVVGFARLASRTPRLHIDVSLGSSTLEPHALHAISLHSRIASVTLASPGFRNLHTWKLSIATVNRVATTMLKSISWDCLRELDLGLHEEPDRLSLLFHIISERHALCLFDISEGWEVSHRRCIRSITSWTTVHFEAYELSFCFFSDHSLALA